MRKLLSMTTIHWVVSSEAQAQMKPYSLQGLGNPYMAGCSYAANGVRNPSLFCGKNSQS